MRKFAQQWWDFNAAKSDWEDRLLDLLPEGEDFKRIGSDYYDCSLEICGATNDLRLPLEMQEFIQRSGFGKVYVNHEDGWETHYTLGKALPARGWRRRYISDEASDTTRVLAGDPDPGYFEISYWPESWGEQARGWLTSGYMRIVADPLDPLASADTHPKGGDAEAAPFMSGAVAESETPNL